MSPVKPEDWAVKRVLAKNKVLPDGESVVRAGLGQLLTLSFDGVPSPVSFGRSAGLRFRGPRGALVVHGYCPSRYFVVGAGRRMVTDLAWVLLARLQPDRVLQLVVKVPGEGSTDFVATWPLVRVTLKHWWKDPDSRLEALADGISQRRMVYPDEDQEAIARAAAHVHQAYPLP